jgi:pimeloyl-ACP methyl ester carboxylesterase
VLRFVSLLVAIVSLLAAASANAAPTWSTLPPPDPLPAPAADGRLDHDGASLWWASFGAGPPVILLHPGAASSDLWGDQVPALVAAGERVLVIDARGHGRSTRDDRALSYEEMAGDVLAVMDALAIDKASVVGWSDGAIVGLVLAMRDPERITAVFAFGANMDTGGLRPLGALAPIRRAAERLMEQDYQQVSPTPGDWRRFSRWVERMQLSQPDYTAADLAAIQGPRIAIADGDHEEFIHMRHTRYLARTIPGAELVILKGVGHFAPLEDPTAFNAAVVSFLGQAVQKLTAKRQACCSAPRAKIAARRVNPARTASPRRRCSPREGC